jgi:hypothetical protein
MAMFQKARVVCDEQAVERLTMKCFEALFQQMDPVSGTVALEGKEDREQEAIAGRSAEGQDGGVF